MECQSQFRLEEFTRSCKSSLIYYQILHMSGSVYIWIGTEAGEQGSLVAALTARPGVDSTPSAVATLMGGAQQETTTACAARLQTKLRRPVFLSLNIPEDLQLLNEVEKTLIQSIA